MSEKTVFISYRRDTAGKFFARSIKEALTHHGYDVFLDVDCLDAGKWATQILTQVPKRAHFLLLLTPGALDRCNEEDDWVRREFLNAIASGRNIVPVREESVDLGDLGKSCPECMRGLFTYQIAAIQHASFKQDIETLIERFIPPQKAPADPVPSLASTSGCRVDISRIDKYAPAELIGREAEMALLNDAWAKAQNHEPKRPHILTIVGLGGEGKTSLVAKWAAELAHQDWPGCDAAFAWSFYSQGARDQATASSDLFLKEALTFFGDPEMAVSAAGVFDKGKRLSQLVGERRALLILDGLEPLQYAPTSPMPGELKDHGISALLKGLAAASRSLCIVTTRYSIPDLKNFRQTTAPEMSLPRLSEEAGVALLKNFDVKGNQNEFEKLVEDVKGHALTLNLLGSYLRDAHFGDIRKRDLVKLEEADAEEQGGHAFRVMDAYVRSFESDGKKGKRALAYLQLLGLFDRPASADCIAALLKTPYILGLTGTLAGTGAETRNFALTRLETSKLITINRDAAGSFLSLDAHPLLREYFAKQLREKNPEAWRAAHRRLYEHLCATTKEGDQPSLEDLQPLYQAVAHGCQAGLQQEACATVYRDRILRGTGFEDGFYSWNKLGAFGSNLGAIACFFETQWSHVSPALTKADQGWLLNETANQLRALGRLTEALEPMQAALEMTVKQEDWGNVAAAAGNLSELELTLGEVDRAVENAEHSVTYADRSGSAFHRKTRRARVADALHQAGRRSKAETFFREAEDIHAKDEPSHPLLYTLSGFQYCDLLLTEAEREAGKAEGRRKKEELLAVCRAVEQRAAQTLKWKQDNSAGAPHLIIALDHLTLGRAALYRAILEHADFQHPPLNLAHLDQAVAGLRRAGQQDDLPRGLLTRAWLRSLTGPHTGPESSQGDLDEAWEIAERGPMPLFLADIHLYRARLFFREATYPWNQHPDGLTRSPKDDLTEARRLIEKHGYWRRKEELEDAEEAILGTKQ